MQECQEKYLDLGSVIGFDSQSSSKEQFHLLRLGFVQSGLPSELFRSVGE